MLLAIHDYVLSSRTIPIHLGIGARAPTDKPHTPHSLTVSTAYCNNVITQEIMVLSYYYYENHEGELCDLINL